MFILCLSQYSPTEHRQEHIFSDFSLITFKFPDFCKFSRLVATLCIEPEKMCQKSLLMDQVQSVAEQKNDVYEPTQIRHLSTD